MDAAHLATKHKYYVERAVQTDMPRSLSRADCKPVNPRVYDLSPTTPATMSNEDTISSNLSHGAYIYSPSSGGHPGPMRSPHLSRKHPQFPYRRPSQRVFSLPETSPPYATVTARETRGVSLTERARVSLTFSDNTPEISSSVETSFRSETRSGSSRARRSLPSSDIPHTPSPPSSPESVMIIGNNMQVPMAFLRQKAKPNHDEETGWISWASSPPKPIPALHGPLSLPYARCPSGAEGTIVEGEDLSRMIWGLGLQDDQPASTNSPNASHKPTSLPPRLQAQRHSQPSLPQQNVPLNRQSHELHRDETVPDARSRRTMQRHALESLGPRHSRVPSLAQQSDSWHDTFGAQSDLLESFEDQLHSYDGQRGLGLDWQETLRHHRTDPEKTKSSVSLKPSAPVFVPASQQTPSQFPRIFVEPRHTIAPSPRLSAFEIAQQYRDKRPQDLLPTPPSSSSPQWTPQQHYIDPFPPLDLHTLVPPPKSQPNFDLSQELRKFVFERMQNPDVIRSAEATYGQSITPRIPQSPRSSFDASPSLPGPPPNSPLPPLPTHANRIRSHYGMEPPSPTSPDLLAPLRHSSKHPRSVPFARLLQRRLSAVPEEETGQYEMHSPPPSPKVSTAIPMRAPRAPSSSQAEGFQSRSHTRTRSISGSRLLASSLGLPSPALSGFGSPAFPAPVQQDDTTRWLLSEQTSNGRVKAAGKLPLKSTNSWEAPASQSQEQTKTDGNSTENLWEKENGKPKKKVRGKKIRGGSSAERDSAETDLSSWLAASSAPEAWL